MNLSCFNRLKVLNEVIRTTTLLPEAQGGGGRVEWGGAGVASWARGKKLFCLFSTEAASSFLLLLFFFLLDVYCLFHLLERHEKERVR